MSPCILALWRVGANNLASLEPMMHLFALPVTLEKAKFIGIPHLSAAVTCRLNEQGLNLARVEYWRRTGP
jgi:hypothetical protein